MICGLDCTISHPPCYHGVLEHVILVYHPGSRPFLLYFRPYLFVFVFPFIPVPSRCRLSHSRSRSWLPFLVKKMGMKMGNGFFRPFLSIFIPTSCAEVFAALQLQLYCCTASSDQSHASHPLSLSRILMLTVTE